MPITVERGMPLVLSGGDLQDYFRAEHLNLSGISVADFSGGGVLPEGVYAFRVTVLDYYSGLALSTSGVSMGWLVLNDPPVLVFPERGTQIPFQEQQYIGFSWESRNLGSANGAFNTEYLFELFEVPQLGMRPEEVVRTQLPLYSVVTGQTQLVYGMGEPPLLANREYAWRVRAQAVASAEDFELFKNSGYSEVFGFKWGEACVPVGFQEVTGRSH